MSTAISRPSEPGSTRAGPISNKSDDKSLDERRTESLLVPAIEVGGGLALVVVLLGLLLVRTRATADGRLGRRRTQCARWSTSCSPSRQEAPIDTARPAIARSPDALPKPH